MEMTLAWWFVVLSLLLLQCSEGSIFNFHDHHYIEHDTMNLGNFVAAINTTIDPIVDARLERMAAAFHPGNFCPFKNHVLTKLIKGEDINIVVVGGSVAYGAELRDRINQRWSHPFEVTLNSKWYKGTFHVNNIAMGACNVDAWIARVNRIPAADLLIVDLSVNDQGFDVQSLPHFYRTFIQLLDGLSFHPALLFNLAFRSAQDHRDEIQSHCPAVNQSISCCGGTTFFCKRWWEMSEYVAMVLKEYRVPYVSYKQLIWPDYWNPPDNLNHFWNGLSHPDYKAHALMAKLIAFGFYINIKASAHKHTDCSDAQADKYVLDSQRDEKIKPLCSNPLTFMSGSDQAESQSSFVLSGDAGKLWKFFADSKQKFGYILEAQKCGNEDACRSTAADRTLSLKINLSEEPVIQVFYLKSFAEEMGEVHLWIDDAESQAVALDGKWNLRTDGNLAYHDSYKIPFSVTRVATLSRGTLSHVSSYVKGDHFLLPALSAGDHVLHIRAKAVEIEKLKFKLIGITTC